MYLKIEALNLLRKIGTYKDLSRLADKVLSELFFIAAYIGNLRAIKPLVETHRFHQSLDAEGNTDLKIAVEREYMDVAKYLINVDVKRNHHELPRQLIESSMGLYK